MKNFFKSLIALVTVSLFLCTPLTADNIVIEMPLNAKSNILAVPTIVDEMTFTTTTATSTRVDFYDSSTLTTTLKLPTYTKFVQYATNYTVIFTNENNVKVTNTFSGMATSAQTVTTATADLPILLTVVVPGNAQRTKTSQLQSIRGLTATVTGAVIIEVNYRKNP